jgi:hypothetical protein
MKIAICSVVLLAAGILWAQSGPLESSHQAAKNNQEGSLKVRGRVSKLNGDYVLMKENPGNTYQLQGGKIRLKSYLGKRVEITEPSRLP